MNIKEEINSLVKIKKVYVDAFNDIINDIENKYYKEVFNKGSIYLQNEFFNSSSSLSSIFQHLISSDEMIYFLNKYDNANYYYSAGIKIIERFIQDNNDDKPFNLILDNEITNKLNNNEIANVSKGVTLSYNFRQLIILSGIEEQFIYGLINVIIDEFLKENNNDNKLKEQIVNKLK